MKQQGTFEEHLQKSNLSENTIHSYLWTVDFYHAHYDEINKENLLAYKGYLMEFFKPKTVNLRIQAMNKYLNFLHKDRLRLKAVKVQQKNFLENVISNADYNFLKKQLKKDDNMEWYFVVWYLAATGARVSELIQIKIEHVELGYFDLYTKGGKLRRLYIPKKLRTETLEGRCGWSQYSRGPSDPPAKQYRCTSPKSFLRTDAGRNADKPPFCPNHIYRHSF